MAGPLVLAPQDLALPVEIGYTGLDTETGGLDQRVNPLLSLGAVVVDREIREIDGFSFTALPPDGTYLEVPVDSHVGFPGYKQRPISHYLDVWTGSKVQSIPEDAYVITSVAAEINGYLKVIEHPDGHNEYDYDAIADWHRRSIPLEELDAVYVRFIKQFFRAKPVPVAHNVSFDDKFIRKYLPELYSNLASDPNADGAMWFCTLQAYRKYRKSRGLKNGKGTCTLVQAVRDMVGYEIEDAHEALADTRGALALLRVLKAKQAERGF